MSSIAIKDLYQKDGRTLGIVWNDGEERFYDVVHLRRQCPCASCVDERTGKRTLRPEQIPESVRPVLITSVGRYALQIAFDDGHKTGIYAFQSLKQKPSDPL